MFRRYELRFVREDGRVLRGPIFGKQDYSRMQGVIDKLDDLSVLRLKFGNLRIVIPKDTLAHGHSLIKPVGPLYCLFRIWRSR